MKNQQLKSLLFLLIFIAILNLKGFCQKKYEKEIRIDKTEVPAAALSMLDSMDIEKKVKWYKEIALDRSSIEAKLKDDGKDYSIEFTEDGTFEDMEVLIQTAEMEASLFKQIKEYLSSEEGKFKIKKAQIQYSGRTTDIIDFFNEKNLDDALTINYELVVSRQIDGSFQLYEYLFNEAGNLLNKAKIILNMTDNLEY